MTGERAQDGTHRGHVAIVRRAARFGGLIPQADINDACARRHEMAGDNQLFSEPSGRMQPLAEVSQKPTAIPSLRWSEPAA